MHGLQARPFSGCAKSCRRRQHSAAEHAAGCRADASPASSILLRCIGWGNICGGLCHCLGGEWSLSVPPIALPAPQTTLNVCCLITSGICRGEAANLRAASRVARLPLRNFGAELGDTVALRPEVMASSSSGGHDGSTRVNFDSLLQSNVTLGEPMGSLTFIGKQVFGKRYLEMAKQW